ncbi:hypothetical protein [Oryzifoliimicrobium ureilyticus]|uniref:hypothetical protein n=1 Tax=Oryzifoliimicrobium ureilyticus TaxID=3113724 RepID=UPI00307670BB
MCASKLGKKRGETSRVIRLSGDKLSAHPASEEAAMAILAGYYQRLMGLMDNLNDQIEEMRGLYQAEIDSVAADLRN